jgi:mannose-6-phosphate isomerase-like protein (cupin superfamily)
MPGMSNYAPTTQDTPTMRHDTPAVVQTVAEADTTQLLGGAITIRLRSQDTDGRVGMIDQIVPGGFPGPALHVHPDFEETFYVLDGTLSFRVGDQTRDGGPGTVAHIPRGLPHTFANPSDQPAHALVIVTPGGFEAYFEALAAAIADHGGFPPVGELVALGIAHGSCPA